MAKYTFDSLLKELGPLLNISNLESTVNSNITLKLNPGNFYVTLQQHQAEDAFFIIFDVIELPSSKFKENVLKAALKYNGLNKSHEGIFGFSKKKSALILFEKLSLDYTSLEQVRFLIFSLQKTASNWKESLERGEIPHVVEEASRHSNPFGIK